MAAANKRVTHFFFQSPTAFRAWLEVNHKTTAELFLAYHKKQTGRPSITWPESVAEALCFGWIDGVRRTLDADSYTVRFTPRRAKSMWSAVNIRLIAELEAAGKMTDAGRAAFEARPHKTGPKAAGYSVSNHKGTFDVPTLRAFKKNKPAWKFFEAQPPGYRGTVAWWVMQAKGAETRERRLAKLNAACVAGKRLR